MRNASDAYELAKTLSSTRQGVAIKLFNGDGYSLGTYVNAEEVIDVHGIQPMGVIGPNESYPVLDVSPYSFQIGFWDEDLRRFNPDNGATRMDLAELERLTLVARRAASK